MELNTKPLTRKKSTRVKKFNFTEDQKVLIIVGTFTTLLITILTTIYFLGYVVIGILAYFVLLQITWATNSKLNRFRGFAKANKFKMHEGLPNELIPPLTGVLADRQDYEFYFEGKLLGRSFTLFLGNFNISRKTGVLQEQWVLFTELEGNLPAFVVDAKYNYVKIPAGFSEYESLKLEGDFSDYFNIYAPSKSQIDVLSVITPDVMEALKEFWQNTDVIVAGTRIWLIGNNMADDDVDLQHLFDSAEAILPELNHRARSYRT